MRIRIRVALLLAAALVTAGRLVSESATPAVQRTAEGARKETRVRRDTSRRLPSILTPAWVNNPGGAPLKPEDFEARLAGIPSTVISVRTGSAPLLLFLAIDLSDSLILGESAKTALAQSIRQAKPDTYVSLLRIPEQPMVLLDPSTDRQAFSETLATLPMSGRAGFFEMVDVIAGVTDPLVRQNPVRVAVLYLTDSEIHNYRQDYTNPVINSSDSRDLSRRFPDALIREKVNTLTNELMRSSTPLFVVHLNYRSDTLNEAYQSGIKRLAQTTGGRSVFCRSIAEIPVAIGDMVNAIQAMNLVEIAVPETVSGAVSLTLESASGPVEYRSLFEIPK